jgi:hypothetical protein
MVRVSMPFSAAGPLATSPSPVERATALVSVSFVRVLDVWRIATPSAASRSNRVRRCSARQRPEAAAHLFVTRMRVHRGRQGTHVPRKPLRQEQVAGLPVDICHAAVPQRMKRVQPIKSGPPLPFPPQELHPPLRDPLPGLVAEQRRVSIQ